MKHYLYMELEGIQRFVFSSPKLKIICGGSALLDTFNRQAMPERARSANGEVVVVGGGHCLVRDLSEQAAVGLAQALQQDLDVVTDGQVRLVWGLAPQEGGWSEIWDRLHQDLAQRTLQCPSTAPPLPPFVALCSSCGASPARGLEDMLDREPKPVCRSCRERLSRARDLVAQGTIWQRLRGCLGQYSHPNDDEAFKRMVPGREFEELAKADGNGGNGYLAYLYCDGNGMGKRLREAASAENYGQLSQSVDVALHKAVASAIERCQGNQEKFIAEVLLLGGDDLIIALPARFGVAFAKEVIERFHHELRDQGDFRLSGGLVIAPYSTPIAILQDVAISLLKSAKRYAYLDEVRQRLGRRTLSDMESGAPRQCAAGYIDFQELTSAQIDLERSEAVTCRPYRIDDFTMLVERVQALRDAKVPKGRLHALNEAVNGSEREALTMAQLVVGRAKNDKQHKALWNLLRPLYPSGAPARVRPFTTFPDPDWDLPFDLYDPSGGDEHRWSVIPETLELIDHVSADEGSAW